MSSLLMSRQDELDRLPAHQRLMANLGVGPLLKSQAHASLLHSTLRQGSNDSAQAKAPGNVHTMIARSVVSDLDREAERKYGERAAKLEEQKVLARKAAARKAALKGGNPGAFANLHAKVKAALKGVAGTSEDIIAALRNLNSAAMAKSIGIEHGESFEERYGIPAHATVAQAVGVKTFRAAVKPAKPVNTIASGFARIDGLLKSMGLEAGYGTDSATLTGGSAIRQQSLPAKPAAKPLSPDELLKAASTLLHHGRIDTQTAARVQSEVNLTGKVSPALMRTLSEACK